MRVRILCMINTTNLHVDVFPLCILSPHSRKEQMFESVGQ